MRRAGDGNVIPPSVFDDSGSWEVFWLDWKTKGVVLEDGLREPIAIERVAPRPQLGAGSEKLLLERIARSEIRGSGAYRGEGSIILVSR